MINRTFLKLILIFVGSLIIAGSGYAGFKILKDIDEIENQLDQTLTNKLPPEPKDKPESPPKDLDSSEIDTSGWLTYRSEELGVEVKYPKDWEVKEDIDYRPIIYKDKTEIGIFGIIRLNQPEHPSNPILEIVKTPGGIGYEFLDFFLTENIEIDGVLTQISYFNPTSSWFGECGEGKTTMKTTKKETAGGFKILFDGDKSEYQIWATYCQSIEQFDPKIFNRILSSFKWINSN